jgi:hypothetical protein
MSVRKGANGHVSLMAGGAHSFFCNTSRPCHTNTGRTWIYDSDVFPDTYLEVGVGRVQRGICSTIHSWDLHHQVVCFMIFYLKYECR